MFWIVVCDGIGDTTVRHCGSLDICLCKVGSEASYGQSLNLNDVSVVIMIIIITLASTKTSHMMPKPFVDILVNVENRCYNNCFNKLLLKLLFNKYFHKLLRLLFNNYFYELSLKYLREFKTNIRK